MNLLGMKIVINPLCYTQEKGDRQFPESRHRSARIHKKLVKRYGGEFKIINKPAAYKIGRDTLVLHPALYEELKKSCK